LLCGQSLLQLKEQQTLTKMDDVRKKFADMRRLARELAPTRWSRKELAQVALLKDAHQETIAPLLRDCPVKLMEPGDVLLDAGNSCHSLYLVLSGRLTIGAPSPDEADTLVRAGDCIGELFLFESVTVASAISAVESTRLLVIDRNTAWNLIRASHEIARNWLSLFAQRSRVRGVIAGNQELQTVHGTPTALDERTGLHSRNWLESMLPREVSRTTTDGTLLGMLLVEIDGFAAFGPSVGDEACRIVADTLAKNFRPTDIIASYGIAQFAVILPGADIASACLAAERVRQAIQGATEYRPDESAVPALTVSIGATQLQPASDAPTLLAAAETALQMAKNRGGNRVGMR
jgi:diguanylate cyclase (GGDEF)-like protein